MPNCPAQNVGKSISHTPLACFMKQFSNKFIFKMRKITYPIEYLQRDRDNYNPYPIEYQNKITH